MPAPHPAPTRRDLLRLTGLGAASLFWDGWQQAEAAGRANNARARSVILIFNCGAPSHLDLLDPKPSAPREVRGPFSPIATAVPGLRLSELLPRLARQARRYSVVRTVHHSHTQ